MSHPNIKAIRADKAARKAGTFVKKLTGAQKTTRRKASYRQTQSMKRLSP